MMYDIDLKSKIRGASKWSVLTQLGTKLILPISYMILTRLLSIDAFGVVAIIMMIVSFADLLTDAGFQKYLIQYEFEDEDEYIKCSNAAFWMNMLISLLLWAVITLFRHKLAFVVGNAGLGNVIAIACIQLPITSFSSIQTAHYQRNFNFKTIFIIQIIVALIPLIVTVPLALLGFSYWSIIIGNICGALLKAIVLTYKSKWKPSLYYSSKVFKKMLPFSIWSLLSEISIWLTSWFDSFIVGNKLDNYHLGMYKNSQSMVNNLISIVQYSANPVMLSALSRLQNDEKAFSDFFLKVQRLMAYLLFPIGVGVFMYRDLATLIVFGSKWVEASAIIGVWGLTSVIRVVMISIYSIAYTAKGKPKFLLIVQLIDLAIIIPTCLISLKSGFWNLVYARAFVRLDLILPGLLLMHYFIRIKASSIIKNILKPSAFTLFMAIFVSILQRVSLGILWSLVSIVLAAMFYFMLIFLFSRNEIEFMKVMIISTRKK